VGYPIHFYETESSFAGIWEMIMREVGYNVNICCNLW